MIALLALSTTLTKVLMEKLLGQPIPRLQEDSVAKARIRATRGIRFLTFFMFFYKLDMLGSQN